MYKKGSEEMNQETIVEICDLMKNRGPDDAGLLVALHVALGHRSLSIIDLSSAGHQSLTNKTKIE